VPLLITVSRFHPEKRLRCLFEAVNIVNKTQPVAHIVFGEGFLLNKHRRYAENSPGIHLAGFTSDREELAQALASSDLLLHGSAAETFGLGVAEGLCFKPAPMLYSPLYLRIDESGPQLLENNQRIYNLPKGILSNYSPIMNQFLLVIEWRYSINSVGRDR